MLSLIRIIRIWLNCISFPNFRRFISALLLLPKLALQKSFLHCNKVSYFISSYSRFLNQFSEIKCTALFRAFEQLCKSFWGQFLLLLTVEIGILWTHQLFFEGLKIFHKIHSTFHVNIKLCSLGYIKIKIILS